MKKKVFLLGVVSAGALAVGLSMVKVTSNNDSFAGNYISHSHAGEGSDYVLSFSGTNLPATITTSFQNSFAGSIKTAKGNDINLTYSNVRVNENMVQVAGHGRIYNYGASNTKISGINGVAFTGQGSLIFRPVLSDGSGKGYVVKEQAVVIAANAAKVDVPVCDYFELEAADGGAALSGLELSYSCDATEANIKLLDGMYTGVGSDSSTYKFVVNNGAVTVSSLDKQTNISISGTATMVSKNRAQCSFTTPYEVTYVMDFDGHAFTQVSKSGAQAAYFPDFTKVNRVYNVEDYESYSASGQGYTNSTTKYQTTGLRATVYADFYTGSSSGEIGGNGWPIMTSTDNTNLLKTKGHNGTQGGAFKFHPSGNDKYNMRYMYMNELYGVKSVIGKGSTLSFWARTPYTDQNYNTDYADDMVMKFYAFFNTPLSPSTQQTYRETFDFTIKKGGTWQHFEFPLTADRNYYGFGFYAAKQGTGTHFVPFDDIQIYTASPYAEYVAPVAVTGVTVAPDTLDLTVGASSTLTATVAPDNATNKNVTWSSDATAVATVDATGKVTAVGVGEATITATTEDGEKTDTCTVTVSPSTLNYPEGTFMAVVGTYKLTIAIGNTTNQQVSVKISTAEANATGITYDADTKAFTITTTGSVGGYTVGDITGNYDPEHDQLINVNCSGQIGAAISNVTLTRPETIFTFDDDTATLQAKYKRRYRQSNSWNVDSTNVNRVVSITDNVLSGKGSLNVKPCGSSYQGYCFNLQNDFATPKTLNSVQFWVYNPCDYDITFRVYYFKGANLSNNGQVGLGASDKAKAHSWTYIARGFTSSAIYNFSISVWTEDQTQPATTMAANLVFDDLLFY